MPIMPKTNKNESIVNSKPNGTISKEKIIIVEGNDEVNFFDYLLKNRSELQALDLRNKVQIIPIQGVNNMKKELSVLKNRSGFDIVKSIAVIRDADSNEAAAFESVKNFLQANNLPAPTTVGNFTDENSDGIKGGIFVIPGNDIPGTMLEDLCLASVHENPIINLVDSYISELQKLQEIQEIEISTNLSKTKILVYLASQKKIFSSLGTGVANFDITNICYNSLVTFLTAM